MNCILLPTNQYTINNNSQITHIRQVLNAQIGDTLTVGEINGNLGTAIIDTISEDVIELTNVTLNIPPPPKLDLTVVLALPRPKVMRRLIMDMTALGVNKIILVNSYRTQKSYWQSPLLTRLDEFVHEGLQQAVDTIPPVIELKKRFKPFVEDEFAGLLQNKYDSQYNHGYQAQSSCDAIIAHPYASISWQQHLSQILNNQTTISKSTIPQATIAQAIMPKVLCIGAEGGWIDYEVDLMTAHGGLAVSLGKRILRTESAVNVMLGGWLR